MVDLDFLPADGTDPTAKGFDDRFLGSEYPCRALHRIPNVLLLAGCEYAFKETLFDGGVYIQKSADFHQV